MNHNNYFSINKVRRFLFNKKFLLNNFRGKDFLQEFTLFFISLFSLLFLSIFFSEFFNNLFSDNKNYINWGSELLLILTILITVINFKKLKKRYYKFSIRLRLLIISIITYEELSFLTLNDAFTFNLQSELNLHNAKFFSKPIFENIPIFDDISFYSFLIFLFFLILSVSSKLKIFDNWMTFNSKYSFLLLIFPLNLIFTTIFKEFNLINTPLINAELSEMFFYLLIFFDTFQHVIKSSRKNIQNLPN